MLPELKEIDLTQMTDYYRSKICTCPTKCDKGVSFTTYNDGFILCWNNSRKHMYNLIKTLDEETRTEWTKHDEFLLLEHFEKRGMYYGFNSDVAAMLGKTRTQVKSKVRRMQKRGMLV